MVSSAGASVAQTLLALADAPTTKGLANAREGVDAAAAVLGRLVASGPLGSRDEDGVQLHFDLSGGGYLSISVYARDPVTPLIVRHGLEPDIGPMAVGSCCMTDVDCGGGLKCLTAEDPCPSGLVRDDPWLATAQGEGLYRGESGGLEALGELVVEVAAGNLTRRETIDRASALRSHYVKGNLLMSIEPDGEGAWYDWLVRLSTGRVARVTLCTNPARKSPIFSREDPNSLSRLQTRSVLLPSLDGELVLLPRVIAE